MENNNKNNIFVKAFVFVAFAIILTVGVTYAYFRATITGVESESTISIGGATLKIVYEGLNSITANDTITKGDGDLKIIKQDSTKENFDDTVDETTITESINVIEEEINKQNGKHEAVTHYIDEYGFVPPFVLTKILT